MTKKDYEAIAKVILKHCHKEGVEDVARDLVEHLQEDNPRFDKYRFLQACGLLK